MSFARDDRRAHAAHVRCRRSRVTSAAHLATCLQHAAWIAAPIATTSSGFTPLCGSRPKNFLTVSCTSGIRVCPPTRITSPTWSVVTFASSIALRTGPIVRSTRSPTSCSSLARVNVIARCFGPEASAVMNGRLTSVCCVVDSSTFALRCVLPARARAVRAQSIPVFLELLDQHR